MEYVNSNNSNVQDEKNGTTLSPENQAILASLVDPYEDAQAKRDADNLDLERMIVGKFCTDQTFFQRFSSILDSGLVLQESHKMAITSTKEHFAQCGKLPVRGELRERVKKLRNPRGETDELSIRQDLVVLSGLNLALDYNRSNGDPDPDFLAAEIHKRASKRITLDLLYQARESNKKGEPLDGLLRAGLEAIENLRTHKADCDGANIDEVYAAADAKFSWYIEKWLPAGTVSIVAGRGKSGKTTWLENQCIDLVYDQIVMGEKAELCPILWLDYENPVWHPANICREALAGKDLDPWRTWFRFYSRMMEGKAALTSYCTVEFIRQIAERAEQRTGKRGIIVIDPLMEAFNSTPDLPEKWSFDQQTVCDLLKPFREWCHESGWSIILISHTSKEGGTYGSVFFKNSVDILTSFSREEGSDLATMLTEGRLPSTPRRSFRLENGKYIYLGYTGDLRQQLKEEKKAMDDLLSRQQFCAHLPVGGDKAVTYAEMSKLLCVSPQVIKRDWYALRNSDPNSERFKEGMKQIGKGQKTKVIWQEI